MPIRRYLFLRPLGLVPVALIAVLACVYGRTLGATQDLTGVSAPDWKDVPPQPGEESWKFKEDLKSPMWTRHAWGNTRPGKQDAVLTGGVRLKLGFTDPKRRLDTAYKDLRDFLAAGGVSSEKGKYTIETAHAPDLG
ncbi:MAG: hypothetical protein ABFD60_10590, partial [Bryobacteraceae bacterium]